MNKNTWYTFQGCVIAVMPLTVSILSGIAVYQFIKYTVPEFVAIWSTIIIAACVYMLAVILKNKLGE